MKQPSEAPSPPWGPEKKTRLRKTQAQYSHVWEKETNTDKKRKIKETYEHKGEWNTKRRLELLAVRRSRSNTSGIRHRQPGERAVLGWPVLQHRQPEWKEERVDRDGQKEAAWKLVGNKEGVGEMQVFRKFTVILLTIIFYILGLVESLKQSPLCQKENVNRLKVWRGQRISQ